MSQKLYALLVGINEYHPESYKIGNLTGCVNDVNAMEQLLHNKGFGFSKTKTETLLNQQATRKGIIGAFKKHLIANAGPDTTTLFYFSGHGSRQIASEVFHKYSPLTDNEYIKEETLICYDSRARRNGKFLEKDLADKELAILIEQAARKGGQVVIILDSCNSGSGTRLTQDRPEVQQIPAQAKTIEDRADKSEALKRSYLGDYYKKMLKKTGQAIVPKSKHLLLAGCKSGWYSYERNHEGMQRGSFTYHLENTIKENPQLTYNQLFKLVYSRLQKYENIQKPEIESFKDFNPDTCFLTKKTGFEKRNRHLVRKVENGWQVETGFLRMPIEKTYTNIQWTIFNNLDAEKIIAVASTEHIHADYTQVNLQCGSLNSTQEYWAEVVGVLKGSQEVGLVAPTQTIGELEKELYSPLVKLVHQEARLHYQLKVSPKMYSISKRGKLLVRDKYDTSAIVSNLEKIATWETLLDKQNHQTTLNQSDYRLTLEIEKHGSQIIVDKESRIRAVTSKGIPIRHNNKKYQAAPYKVYAENLSGHSVYFTLLCLNPDYGIRVYEHLEINGSKKMLLFDQGLFTTLGQATTVSYLKLIVSTNRLVSTLFNQEPITGGRRISLTREETEIVAPSDDWLTKTVTLIVEK